MFWVYILTNTTHTTLYVGVTRDLPRRLQQHRLGSGSEFVRKYRLRKLVWAESTELATDAFEREKQIKRWRREKKIRLIEAMNPGWDELSVV